jgi:hypothetical protein
VSITVTSSTDSPEQVNAAATAGDGDELVHAAQGDATAASKRENEGIPTIVEAGPRSSVASTTDSEQQVAAVAEAMKDEHEEHREEYMGKTRRKLVNQVSRQREQIEELRGKLSRYEGQPPHGDDQANAGELQAAQQHEQQPQQQESVNQQQADEQFRVAYQQACNKLPERWEAAKAKYSDLEEVFSKCDRNNPLPLTALFHLQMLDDGHDVGYYLAKNPGRIAKLWQLESSGRGDQMIAELNRISAGLQFHADTRPPQRGQRQVSTSAPAPIRPVGSGASRSTVNPGEMSFEDYQRWRDRGGGSRR